MKAFAVFAFLAVILATVYGAAVEVEKSAIESAEVTPIQGQESAVAPKEDLKGAESVYAALPYVAPAPAPAVLPYAYPYYRYAYPYGYPYALPAAYYLRR